MGRGVHTGKHSCVYSCLCVVLGVLSTDGPYGQSWRSGTISWGFISLVVPQLDLSAANQIRGRCLNAVPRPDAKYQIQCSLTNQTLNYYLSLGFLDYYLSLGSFD